MTLPDMKCERRKAIEEGNPTSRVILLGGSNYLLVKGPKFNGNLEEFFYVRVVIMLLLD